MRLAPLPPSLDSVARYMGLPDAAAQSDDVIRSIRGGLSLAEPHLHPVALYAVFEVRAVKEDCIDVSSGDSNATTLPCTGALFKGISHVQLSLITLGSGLEDLLQHLYTEDPLTAMACDAAGSAALAAGGSAFLEKRKTALAAKGLELAITYVPGCQALPLIAQEGIFHLLQPRRLGVRLSESCLMHPAKSATSVAPLAPTLPGWMKKLSPCQLCNLRDTCNFKATKI